MEKIISNAEIKLYTGLTDADAKLDIFNTSMTRLLAEIIGMKQFTAEEVSLEEVSLVDGGYYFRVRSFPVDVDTLTLYYHHDQTEEIPDYTYRGDHYDFRKIFILDSAGLPTKLPYPTVFASYMAGYVLQDTIEVADLLLTNATLTITSLGVSTNYTFIPEGVPSATQILIGEDETATATNIAAKITNSIASSAVVTLPLGVVAAITQTLGVGDSYSLTIVNSDVPQELKMAIAYMVAGALNDKMQVQGVSEYRLGSKSVKLRDVSEKNFMDEVVTKYAGKYKRINIF